MKILVITFGDLQAGSTKYRIAQYESFFKSRGAELEYIHKHQMDGSILQKVQEADLIINQKCLLPISLSKKIFQFNKKVIFDFDDAIYTRPGKAYSWLTGWRVMKRLRMWLREADVVTVANHYLKRVAEREARRAEVLPMTLDLEVWKPRHREEGNVVNIGWAGAPANLHHIEALEPVLAVLLKKNPCLRLSIYSGKRPALSCPYEFVPFQEGSEAAFVQRLNIGLLPLSDEEFSRGKSPIKAIQYLACGVPVVGNVYGATGDILNEQNSLSIAGFSDWQRSIQELIDSPEKAARLGANGRRHIEENFDLNKIQERFWQLLVEIE